MIKRDSLQGSLDLMVLKILSRRPRLHGYAIMTAIQEMSEEVLRVEEGSLYPALHRMEEAGWIRAAWVTKESGRRARVYDLTATGRKQLADEARIDLIIRHAAVRQADDILLLQRLFLVDDDPRALGQLHAERPMQFRLAERDFCCLSDDQQARLALLRKRYEAGLLRLIAPQAKLQGEALVATAHVVATLLNQLPGLLKALPEEQGLGLMESMLVGGLERTLR